MCCVETDLPKKGYLLYLHYCHLEPKRLSLITALIRGQQRLPKSEVEVKRKLWPRDDAPKAELQIYGAETWAER